LPAHFGQQLPSRSAVLSDALASQSLGQLVENYDDPVYSAAERLIVADCPPSRPSALHPDVAAAVASSPVASRTVTVTSPPQASRQNARHRCDIEVHCSFNAATDRPCLKQRLY